MFVLLVPVAVIAIYFPWAMGLRWVTTYWSLVASFIVPVMLVGTLIPDSFAGERERHTLPTLLATRLSDRAILFGKLATSIAYGWLATLLVLLIALVTVNVVNWTGEIQYYAPVVLLTDVAFALLMSTFVAGLGVLISLRASSTLEAQQTLVAAIMFPALVLGVVTVIIANTQPGLKASIVGAFTKLGTAPTVALVALVLVAVCAGTVRAAMRRFRRARLILE
jgi:ABC-2 type transport system permease protein